MRFTVEKTEANKEVKTLRILLSNVTKEDSLDDILDMVKKSYIDTFPKRKSVHLGFND